MVLLVVSCLILSLQLCDIKAMGRSHFIYDEESEESEESDSGSQEFDRGKSWCEVQEEEKKFKRLFFPPREQLHELIRNKDVNGVRNILKKEPFITHRLELATPNIHGFRGELSTIQVALHSGNAEILKLVLCAYSASEKPLVNGDYCAVLCGDTWHENDLIHDALRYGYFDIIRMLLDYDVNVRTKGFKQETPLFIATYKYKECKSSNHQNKDVLLTQWLDIIEIIRSRCTY